MTERSSTDKRSERPVRTGDSSVDVDRIRTVVDQHPVRLALLFGSQATGTADDESDVDIVVEFDAGVERSGERLLSLLTDLSVALDRNDIDLAVVDDLIRIAVTVYRDDRPTAGGRCGNDLQQSVSVHASDGQRSPTGLSSAVRPSVQRATDVGAI